MFLATLLTKAKLWKQPRCPSMEKWINRMQWVHTTEHSLALKKEDILVPATTWISRENVSLSEISQSQKTNSV